MREYGGLNFYRNLMKHEVTAARNMTTPKDTLCCYYYPDFKYMKCLLAKCPYGKPDKDYFRKKPLPRDKFPCREVVNGWKKNGFTVIKEVEREDWTVLVAEKKL